MNQITHKNFVYSLIGAGASTTIECARSKQIHPIQSFAIGLTGAYAAQAIGIMIAKWKANRTQMTPDTFVNDFIAKQPTADMIRITGIIAGMALYHLFLKED